MLLETRTVSRKTPGDGRLEIAPTTADRLRPLGASLPLRVGDASGQARLSVMPCTCSRAGSAHEHHFVESPLLRALTPERSVEVELEGGTLAVREV